MPTLGWQGFTFEHPDEWVPVAVTGNRSEGYLRMESGSRMGCQVRWKHVRKPGDLKSKLDAYFLRLEKDAKKAREAFGSSCEQEEGRWVYRWTGRGQARGSIFFNQSCSRIFFLEALGGRKDSLLPTFRSLLDSFQSERSPKTRWSVFGLEATLPSKLMLKGKSFLSGRTTLTFCAPLAEVVCDRWAFAEQLMAKHDLRDWARAALNLPKAVVTEEAQGLLVEKRLPRRTIALVKVDTANNQIVAVKSTSRLERWRPSWDWLP